MNKMDCVGCGKPMDAVVGVCPSCGRPNDENEIEYALGQEKRDKLAARARVSRLISWGVILVVALILFVGRGALMGAYRTWKAQFDRRLDQVSDGIGQAPPGAVPVVVSSTSASALGIPSGDVVRLSTAIAYSPPVEPVPAENQWVLAGRTLDLKTLKPLGHVQLHFRTKNSDFFAESDVRGEVRVLLSRGEPDGYTVHISSPPYAPLALCDPDIPYADLSASDRAQLIGMALDGDGPVSHVVEPDINDPPRVHRDLFFAPRER
ncbi:MAG: hypothetical protein KGJ84_08380 [Elusimicrobia bacterium]|nr:hypothetical protein [Elusimicrobiota bacterium]